MREIKFRIWDDEQKCFLPTDDKDVYWNCSDGILTAHLEDKKGDWRELQIMQFTGLKDKNGVEIFEGDRCNSNYFKKGVVAFWNSGWHFEVGIDLHYSFNTASHTFEVIGNIYQS
jgi:uncharacterized phage protein (TIGR01671 family)